MHVRVTFSYDARMSTRSNSPERDEWLEACRIEREAWEKVKDHTPGSPSYDPAAWGRWQAALKKAAEAARKYDQSKNKS
jgi:hypothetical protein